MTGTDALIIVTFVVGLFAGIALTLVWFAAQAPPKEVRVREKKRGRGLQGRWLDPQSEREEDSFEEDRRVVAIEIRRPYRSEVRG